MTSVLLAAFALDAPVARSAFLELLESECSVNALAQVMDEKERVIDGEGEPCVLMGSTPTDRVANASTSAPGGSCFVSAYGHVRLYGGVTEDRVGLQIDTVARNETFSTGSCSSDPRTVTRVHFVWVVTQPLVDVEFQALVPCESNGNPSATLTFGGLQLDLTEGCTQEPVMAELAEDDLVVVDVGLQEGRCCNDSELFAAFTLRSVPEPRRTGVYALLALGWLAHRRRKRCSSGR